MFNKKELIDALTETGPKTLVPKDNVIVLKVSKVNKLAIFYLLIKILKQFKYKH